MTDQPDFDWDKAIALAKQDELRVARTQRRVQATQAQAIRAQKRATIAAEIVGAMWTLAKFAVVAALLILVGGAIIFWALRQWQ